MPERRPARPSIRCSSSRTAVRKSGSGSSPSARRCTQLEYRPVDGVPHDHDHLDAGDVGGQPSVRGAVVQVEGRALAPDGARRSAVEQAEVLLPPPHPLPRAVRVAGAALAVARRRPAVGQVELRLLDRRQVEPRVRGQGGVQRGRAGLGRTGDHELGQAVVRRTSAGPPGWRVGAGGVDTAGSSSSRNRSRPVSSTPSRPGRPPPPEVDRFWADAEVVLEPEDPRPGSWAGGPSAQLVDGTWWLAYRLRRPVGEGRGIANVVARSDDGVRFTPVVGIGKDALRRGVARAAGPRAHARRPVAALRQLRDAGHEALAGGPPGGRHGRGARHRDAPHRPARGRRHRGQGPGDPARRARRGTCGPRCTRSTTPTRPTG